MIGDDDLGIFYDADALGSQCARRRPGVADVPFVAIMSAQDQVALNGYAVAADYELKYPTGAVDLDAGDRVLVGVQRNASGAVVLVGGAAQGGVAYKVKAEPRRINDGAETVAQLSSVPA